MSLFFLQTKNEGAKLKTVLCKKADNKKSKAVRHW